jgi:bifunctional non-homologous end joining protein LigD
LQCQPAPAPKRKWTSRGLASPQARWLGLVRLIVGVSGILFSEALAAEGEVVFAKAYELGLEGVVSKREGSFYRCGKSHNWLKAKNPGFRHRT